MINTRAALRQNLTMIVLLLMVAVISGFSAAWDAFSGKRWFRDITMQTPFYAVTVEAEPVSGGLVVRGTMVKRRCEYQGLRAYVVQASGLRFPVALDLSPETDVWGGGSRPPSEIAEAWGRGSYPRRATVARQSGKSLRSIGVRTVGCM
ncbi:hypothetical protein ETW23_06045 [Leisingera sp. NJS201]|uniref:hypothetical protein n=1 Tax=Leisingera sp. NJS201 TaxID=2508306 RepID=UPI0010715641|nr:hypothetical protein [Leisingera sp. NJS201]QBR35770.1 hypothetical protein ETW23_06045 [Leisingera sp. NJS201]